MFAFAENHTKKNWYSRLSVRWSSGIGTILRRTDNLRPSGESYATSLSLNH